MAEKFLFYIDSMCFGGANRVMCNLVNHFSSQGIDVVLINDISLPENMGEYEVSPLVKRIYLNVQSKSLLTSNIKRIRKIRTIVKNEHPDAVISFMGPPNFRMLFATAGLRCRKIVSVRNDPYMEYGKGVAKALANIVFMLADGCVFQTKQAAEYFTPAILRRSKIIFNPVGNQFYHVKRVENPRDIITVGRLMAQKNHKLLIEAFSKIAKEFPDENLVIYGEGELRDTLEAQSKKLGLEGRVKLPGATTNVAEKLSSAKVFVLSSDYEGMPNALMEAMAVGAPVISTDCPCGGPAMLIEEDSQGILVPCQNAEKLANALRLLLESKDLRLMMGESCKERALQFSPDIVFSQWKEYIEVPPK